MGEARRPRRLAALLLCCGLQIRCSEFSFFKTISKALKCHCVMCVYLESKWKGPVFPIRCPWRKGTEADDIGRAGHFAEKRSAWGWFSATEVSRPTQHIADADKHPWGEAQNLYLPYILDEHTKSVEFIFHFQRMDICLPLRDYTLL